MPKKREKIVDIEAINELELNSYELSTLFYTYDKNREDEFVLTKTAGLWPILFTSWFSEYDISEDEIEEAIKKTIKKSFSILDVNYMFYSDLYSKIYFNRPGDEKLSSLLRISPLEAHFYYSFSNNLFEYHDESRNTYYIYNAIERYYKTLKDLEDKGLIKDPIDPTGIGFVIGLIPYSFNVQKYKGRLKITHIKSLLWEFNRKERSKDGHIKEEYEFNFKLINLIKRFFNGLASEFEDFEDKGTANLRGKP
jgi:hypothetical protein